MRNVNYKKNRNRVTHVRNSIKKQRQRLGRFYVKQKGKIARNVMGLVCKEDGQCITDNGDMLAVKDEDKKYFRKVVLRSFWTENFHGIGIICFWQTQLVSFV